MRNDSPFIHTFFRYASLFAVCHLAERFGLQGLGPLEVRRSNSLTISLRPKYYGISTDSADEVSKISTPDAVSNC